MAVSKPIRGASPTGLSFPSLGPASTCQEATSVAPYKRVPAPAGDDAATAGKFSVADGAFAVHDKAGGFLGFRGVGGARLLLV